MRGRRHDDAVRFAMVAIVLACAVIAGPARAQDPAAADSTAATAPVAATATAEPDTLDLPEIAQPEPVNLWSTGASPAGAVLMSPLFPGWGQLYTDSSWRAALAYGSQMWFWSRMLTRDRQAVRARHFAQSFEPDTINATYYNRLAEEDWEQMRDFAWWSGASLLIIALDAYVGAHLFHFDSDPVPVPNRWDEIFGPPGEQAPGSTDNLSMVVFQFGGRF